VDHRLRSMELHRWPFGGLKEWVGHDREYNTPHLDIQLPIPDELVGADDLRERDEES
jgi:hypothetical protein